MTWRATPWVRLYSLNSDPDRRAFYRFLNRGNSEVDLVWYDYNGAPVCTQHPHSKLIDKLQDVRFPDFSIEGTRKLRKAGYVVSCRQVLHNLQPRTFKDIDTFEGHPWQAVQKRTNRALHLNGRFIFHAKKSQRRVRRPVVITEPGNFPDFVKHSYRTFGNE